MTEFDEGSFKDNMRVASSIHRDLDCTRNNIRQLSKNIKDVSKAVQILSQHFQTFSEQFQQFSFSEEPNKKEPTMYHLGLMFKDYSHIFNQFQFSWQNSSNLIEKCAREVLVTENLNDVKLRVSKATDVYEKLQKKNLTEKSTKTKTKQELVSSGLDLNAVTVDYYDRLNKMNSQSRKEFWDQINDMMEVNTSMIQALYTTTQQYNQERVNKYNESKKGMEDYKYLDQLHNSSQIERKQVTKKLNIEEPSIENFIDPKDDCILSGNLQRMHGRKQWSNRWVVIGTDGILRVFKKKKDLDSNPANNKTPKDSKGQKDASEFELILCTVRPVQDPKQPFNFEIIHPRKRVTFKTDNITDYQKWIECITNSIGSAIASSSELTNKRMSYFPEDFSALHQLMVEPSNKICADCEKSAPEWVSINTGAFICIECSGIHRSFGTHISKVRSLTMDAFPANLVSYLELLPNKVVNSIFEAEIPLGLTKPQPDSPRNEILQWLTAKYVDKSMVLKYNGTINELHDAFFTSITKVDVLSFVKLIAQGANPEQIHEGKTLLSHTIIQNNQLMAEALIVNGADVNATSIDGKTAIFFAVEKGMISLVKLLVGHDADLQAVDNQGCDLLSFLKSCKEKEKILENITVLDNIESYLQRKITSYQPTRTKSTKGLIATNTQAIVPKVPQSSTPKPLTKVNKSISPRMENNDQSPAKNSNLFRDGAALSTPDNSNSVNGLPDQKNSVLDPSISDTHISEVNTPTTEHKVPARNKLTVKFSDEHTNSSVIWQKDSKLSQILKRLCDARSLVLENYEVRDLETLAILDIEKTLGTLQVHSVLVQKKSENVRVDNARTENTKVQNEDEITTSVKSPMNTLKDTSGAEDVITPSWKRRSGKRFSSKKAKSTNDLFNSTKVGNKNDS